MFDASHQELRGCGWRAGSGTAHSAAAKRRWGKRFLPGLPG